MESKVIVQPGTVLPLGSEVVLGSVMVSPIEKALVYEVAVGFELVMGSRMPTVSV